MLIRSILAALLFAFSFTVGGVADSVPKIAVLELKGEIDVDQGDKMTAAVEAIRQDLDIKGVLLVVDSPGGDVVDSQVIYEELAKLRVPVVAWCNRVCASGGYYAITAPSIKYIAVRQAAIVGSIGVIMTATDCKENCPTIYKSGSLKQAESDNHKHTQEEIDYMTEELNQIAALFYDHVAKARPNLTKAQWDAIKTARVFFNGMAVKAGLADAVMSREEAFAKVQSLTRERA